MVAAVGVLAAARAVSHRCLVVSISLRMVRRRELPRHRCGAHSLTIYCRFAPQPRRSAPQRPLCSAAAEERTTMERAATPGVAPPMWHSGHVHRGPVRGHGTRTIAMLASTAKMAPPPVRPGPTLGRRLQRLIQPSHRWSRVPTSSEISSAVAATEANSGPRELLTLACYEEQHLLRACTCMEDTGGASCMLIHPTFCLKP
mmetsp:Transcript_6552/g.16964  ORF Transcript_6552/g.16964 Transcript_6552/m.16964 type:complete len:201 (-) Transcript_6552:71-673(-)